MADKEAHTPGPWAVERLGNKIKVREGTPSGSTIATISVYRPTDIRVANARLIAAAPELLAALELAKRIILSGGTRTGEADNIIDAAIAKAKGE